jgi:chromosome segregation ATPase
VLARVTAERERETVAFEQMRAEVAAAHQKAVERATDVELQLDEARMRIEFLTEEATRVRSEARDHAQQAALEFKRERLRLIDEKQNAASGSQEAMIKLQGFIDDNIALRARLTALEAERDSLRSAAHTAAEQVANLAEEARRSRDELADATARMEDIDHARDRAQATLGAVQVHARALEEKFASAEVEMRTLRSQLDAERAARVTADNARRAGEIGAREDIERHERAAALQLAELRARTDEELATARARAADAARGYAEALDDLRATGDGLRQERNILEAALAEARSLRDEAASENAHLQRELGATGQFLVELERRLREAEALARTQTARADDLDAELARSRLAVAEAAAPTAWQAERQALRAELAALQAARDAGANAGAALRSSHVDVLSAGPGTQDAAAAMTLSSLIDGLEPLHLGLDAAVDYIASFEDSDPVVTAHLRTLRLVAATVGRLLGARARPRGNGLPGT